MVLPAAPYIFPQRSFFVPSVPPAIVLFDSNIPTLNKPVPIVSRNNGDSTKTTMVNILPISAYSRPLSATKQKKINVKIKSDGNKKTLKKNKQLDKPKDTNKLDNSSQAKTEEPLQKSNPKENREKVDTNKEIGQDKPDPIKVSDEAKINDSCANKIIPSKDKIAAEQITKDNIKTIKATVAPDNSLLKKPEIVQTKTPEKHEPKESNSTKNVPITTTTTITTASEVVRNIKTSEDITKLSKSNMEKCAPPEDKDKLNKLPNILDTTLCDSAVDGGNARLELAEEFLAASPTAAFLMSFPLVSGNRADSPAEEAHNTLSTAKDISQRRNDIVPQIVPTSATFFDKPNNNTTESKTKIIKTVPSTIENKQNVPGAVSNAFPKPVGPKITPVVTSSVTNDNPFLNLSMPSVVTTSCTLTDTTFGLDFDCNINKPTSNQATTYVSNSNIFYKNDPFSTVKSTIYSTSSITSNHEFNGLGLYPCAMEKYSTKNKSDYGNLDDKMGSSRLTYDIDLGWSHKGFDFVNCSTTTTTFNKDNILTTMSSTTPFSTSYNPFNPEFHMPLVSSSNRKENAAIKTNSTFTDNLTSFYSQTPNLWSEEPFYTTPNVSKTLSVPKHQSYLPLENVQTANVKQNSNLKPFTKEHPDPNIDTSLKTTNNPVPQTMNEKYNKKSPSKMHINWMTSEIRPMQSNFNHPQTEVKEAQKLPYNHFDHTSKRTDNDTNSYFPISMHNFPSQSGQEEFQVWPSHRPLGTTEISIDPPPINLPTLVGDLALGPHDKKKHSEATNRILPQQDLQNCSNFFSVTQLMNRSNENITSRYQHLQSDSKPNTAKQNVSQYANDNNRKIMTSRVESNLPQPYIINDSKLIHSYDNTTQFQQPKTKSNSKADKNSKTQKNNYSAEAILRGGNCSQKIQDHKFLMSQKYNDYNSSQDTSVAQVSHFPPILDYTENSYAGQQFSGTSLYNATTNTLSNSFYSNFMPGSGNLMSTNYPSGPFTGEFIDYNQTTECNYTNHKYDELKMRNNPPVFPSEKVPSNYKSSRRDSAAKHKLECSKKESSKKYQSKRAKLNNDVEDWNDPSHALWQNKSSSKRHSNLMSEELPFPNYVGNQMPSQYQPDFFNSHLMPSNMQAVSHNVDRSLASFPITSRANFNLSTIFPEITMVSTYLYKIWF